MFWPQFIEALAGCKIAGETTNRVIVLRDSLEISDFVLVVCVPNLQKGKRKPARWGGTRESFGGRAEDTQNMRRRAAKTDMISECQM